MYVRRAGSLGDEAAAPPPSLTSFCASYPQSEQCLHPTWHPIDQGRQAIHNHWGILLGVAIAGFVVYKVTR